MLADESAANGLKAELKADSIEVGIFWISETMEEQTVKQTYESETANDYIYADPGRLLFGFYPDFLPPAGFIKIKK